MSTICKTSVENERLRNVTRLCSIKWGGHWGDGISCIEKLKGKKKVERDRTKGN